MSGIPLKTDSDETWFEHLLSISEPAYFSVQSPYLAFNVQAAKEIGYYGYDIRPFRKYLDIETADDYLRRVMLPAELSELKFDSSLYEPQKPELMLEMIQVRERRDDENWTRNQNAVMGIRSDSYWEDLSDWLQTSSRGRYLDAQTRNALEKRLRRQKVTDRQGGLLLKCVDWSKRSGWCEPYEPEARVQHEAARLWPLLCCVRP